ncbi:hypothetical protein VNO78_25188 [Psophocarpus tetragonolobus]|uniref:Disease resistance protein At4g27190-like leucine-rich repeats domain-containing protein n=1 Tax=Psophocarpus tetragonolobus TaxID=3891 RepID=A0AAN9XF55_PSOTE
MEISVRMSYDHLENEELKSIFLLCAQMGHQPLIMDLVKYCYGLGILEGVYSLREARDRINTSIQKLKDSSLILDGGSSNHFNMLDMVRDAALSIAHKEQNVFTLRNGKLDDWPELKRCTSISICNSDIIDELPNVINCPQLKFFQIDSHDPSLKIPENFFKGMKRLRVLILTGIHLPSLPSSIKCLSNLRFLCLEQCILDGNLSFIRELKKLKVLSFSGSQIENFPAELGCLDMLQLLDISNCSIVTMILPIFMSRLTCLEELYIRKSLIKMLTKGETNQSPISFLSELKHLHELKVVDLCIPRAAVLPLDLFFDKLNYYNIVIGDFRMLSVGHLWMPNKYEASRSLALQLNNSANNIHSLKGIKLMFKKVESLLLGEINGVENVIYELNLDGFPHLKHLSIINNTCIKYIINSMDMSHLRDVFPNLESLCLYNLRNIEMICCSPISNASFTKLKTIKVERCSLLKNLFSFYMVKFLASVETIDVEIPNLESLNLSSVNIHKIWSDIQPPCLKKLKTLFISNCRMMEKIFSTEGNRADKVCVFPNLEEIQLSEMKMLTDIWQAEVTANSFSSLISVHIEGCEKLEKIFPCHMEGWFTSLESLKVVNCKSVEVIFEIKDSQQIDAYGIETSLQFILVEELPNMEQIWSKDPEGILDFKKLRSVQVSSCDKLWSVFPASVAKNAEKLEYMSILGCNQMVEVVACEDGLERKNETLVFPELTYMGLYFSGIKRFYEGRYIVSKIEAVGSARL